MANSKFLRVALSVAALVLAVPLIAFAQGSKPPSENDWQHIVEAAKQEGKVVASVPPSAELRKRIADTFTKRYGVTVELISGRGATVINRIAEEAKAGVKYFDLHIGGTESIVKGLMPGGLLEPVEPWFVLTEVKDPKNWWGGYVWIDNAERFIYSFAAYQTESLWQNSELVKANEFHSFDDFLDPKWEGKIGMSDPRTPGSGASMWSYMRAIKGEEFLKKLVGQKLFLTRDLRLLADHAAKGQISMAIGIAYAEFLPFIKAGLPVKPLPPPKEGMYTTTGYGSLTIIKNAPHPNAAKVFVNWFLGKEGQDVYTRSMGEPTRRLDVETGWLKQSGITAAKDVMTIDQFYKRQNQTEEMIYKVRDPGAALARKLLD
jgi:iron(III) transport system substrate-binding protein